MRRTLAAHPVLPWLCALSLAGCTDRQAATAEYHQRIPVSVALDLVLVIDNSGSMQAEQEALAAGFPDLLDALRAPGGALPDLHVGVLSSNAGAAGQSGVPGCPNPGDDGGFLTGPPGSTCAAQYGLSGPFATDVAQADGSRLANHDAGQLAPLLGCMAALGTGGCGFEMHLESLHRALQPGRNPGFLRDDARLAVIILADEDDCSTEVGTLFGDPLADLASPLGPRTSFRCHEFGVVCDDDPAPRAFGPRTGCRPRTDSPYQFELDRYVGLLRGLKADPSQVVVAGILGDFDAATGALTVVQDPTDFSPALQPAVERSCHTLDPADPMDGASPPVRLQAFLDAFPGRHATTSICREDLRPGLREIAGLVRAAMARSCLGAAVADRGPASGLQPVCSVTEVPGPGGLASRIIPACASPVQAGRGCAAGGAATPCWCIHPDAAECPLGPDRPRGFALEVERGGAAPASGAVLEVECLVTP